MDIETRIDKMRAIAQEGFTPDFFYYKDSGVGNGSEYIQGQLIAPVKEIVVFQDGCAGEYECQAPYFTESWFWFHLPKIEGYTFVATQRSVGYGALTSLDASGKRKISKFVEVVNGDLHGALIDLFIDCIKKGEVKA